METTSRSPGACSAIQASSRVAAAVVGDRAGGDRSTGRERDLDLVDVAVGVDTDHGVDNVCEHGHRPGPSNWERVDGTAPAWVGVTERHICDGSRPRGGQASDQANWWARPVPATTADKSQTQGTPKRPDSTRVTPGHRHRAWWSSAQEHRSDTHERFHADSAGIVEEPFVASGDGGAAARSSGLAVGVHRGRQCC